MMMRFFIYVFLVSICAGCQSFSFNEQPQQTDTQPSLASAIERWETGYGGEVWFYQNSNLPMVDIELTFDAGALNDGEKLGLANITNELIGEAAKGKNAQQISEAFEQQGAIFSTSVVKTRASMSLRSLTGEPLTIALNQLEEILAFSEFNEQDFERTKQQLETYFKYLLTDVGYQESILMDIFLFYGHPLKHPIIGGWYTVEKLTVEEVRAFWQQHYTRGNVDIAITGDLSLQQAKVIASSLLKQLHSTEDSALNSAQSYPKQLSTDLKYPNTTWNPFNSKQSQIHFAQLTVGRDHKDYVALKIASQILGGGSSSRLYKDIREDKGLSYSVGSYFSSVLNKGEFGISLQTETSQSQEAVDAVNAVVKQWHDQGVSEEELRRAKAKFNLSLGQYLTQNKGINSYLSMMAFEDLSPDYLDVFFETIEQLSVEDVNQAIQHHIDIDAWKLVVLGAEKN